MNKLDYIQASHFSSIQENSSLFLTKIGWHCQNTVFYSSFCLNLRKCTTILQNLGNNFFSIENCRLIIFFVKSECLPCNQASFILNKIVENNLILTYFCENFSVKFHANVISNISKSLL